jgi:hypothetical protein
MPARRVRDLTNFSVPPPAGPAGVGRLATMGSESKTRRRAVSVSVFVTSRAVLPEPATVVGTAKRLADQGPNGG